jgi:hypothetical protein
MILTCLTPPVIFMAVLILCVAAYGDGDVAFDPHIPFFPPPRDGVCHRTWERGEQ